MIPFRGGKFARVRGLPPKTKKPFEVLFSKGFKLDPANPALALDRLPGSGHREICFIACFLLGAQNHQPPEAAYNNTPQMLHPERPGRPSNNNIWRRLSGYTLTWFCNLISR